MAKKRTPPPNRIAKLRKAKGLSAADLARATNTTQPTITRLENGTMQLTEDWMRRISQVLDCSPNDLLREAARAELTNDVEPYLPEAMSEISAPLAAKNLFYYKVISSVVAHAGIERGKLVLIDKSPEAIEARSSGDIVLLRARRDGDGERTGYLLIRQYLAPDLFVTNRAGRNSVFREHDEDGFTVTVRGVVVPGRTLQTDEN